MGYLNGKFYGNNISQTSCSRNYSMTRFQNNYDPDMNNKFEGEDILLSRDTKFGMMGHTTLVAYRGWAYKLRRDDRCGVSWEKWPWKGQSNDLCSNG
ncbi:hypothetical protein V1477_013246 [Vespula maculifrons]|uniref:Uncharacterized protein n=1 Tax=Vespula maculifrons TaxID=7453 RepID=A0ABD2BVD8_VESMC